MLYKEKNPHGGDIYDGDIRLDFSANTNPFGTPVGVREAVSACLSELHRYPDPRCRRLVAAIAAREGVPEGSVLCGAGAAELIYSYCAAVKPETALELAPTFSEYSLALENTGCRVFRHVLREEEDFAVTERLLSDIREISPDVVFLCDPNNPTGRLTDTALRLRILETAASIGARVFMDECFIDLSENDRSLVPELSGMPFAAVLKAFTKSFGMAGVRLGYIVCSDQELLHGMSRTVQPWNVSTVAQTAGLAALNETGFIEKTRSLLKTERPRMEAELRALGVEVFPSDVNFLLFRADPDLASALRRQGILIRDCSNFRGLGPGFFRTAVRLPEENDALIEAIRGILWQRT